MRQNETYELTFTGPVLSEDWARTNIQAEFTWDGGSLTVPGFYDGDGIYKVRFLPKAVGNYHWKVTGIVAGEGNESCVPSDIHGMVKAEGTAFVYQNGERYLPLGTTVYALIHQPDELVNKTLETLNASPFNKVRMCVFPKHFDFNHNDPPCFPFEKNTDGSWDVCRPNIAFWHRFENILDRMGDIEIDLILFHPYDCWGFSSMGRENNLLYLDYLLRRLAARPNVWWSLANEYDILLDRMPMDQWYEIDEFIAVHDPYGHLLSNHHCVQTYDFSRPNVTHVCLQSPWVQRTDEWLERYGKPVIFDELCYEGNIPHCWGNITAFEMVNRFWCVYTKGGYATHGDTFLSPDDVLWWAKGGELKGRSVPRLCWMRDIFRAFPGPVTPVYSTANTVIDYRPQEQPAEIPNEVKLFSGLIMGLDEKERELFLMSGASYAGRCEDDVLLYYTADRRPAGMGLHLPEGRYTIEILDVWNMTRITALTGASGKVDVPLPGKPGIAILATKER